MLTLQMETEPGDIIVRKVVWTKSMTSARVYMPKTWGGRNVIIILQPEKPVNPTQPL